jgi:hypothetical protein
MQDVELVISSVRLGKKHILIVENSAMKCNEMFSQSGAEIEIVRVLKRFREKIITNSSPK